VSRIRVGVGSAELLGLLGEAGAEVVGVAWRVPLDQAAARIGPERAVQGNLDPAALFAPWEAVAAEVDRVLVPGRAAPGRVFTRAHVVLPGTSPDMLARVVDRVHTGSTSDR